MQQFTCKRCKNQGEFYLHQSGTNSIVYCKICGERVRIEETEFVDVLNDEQIADMKKKSQELIK